MLRFFHHISAAEALAQQTQTATLDAAQHAREEADRQRTALLKRGPGRPKKVVDANAVVMAAAAQNSDEEEQPAKRGKYNNW